MRRPILMILIFCSLACQAQVNESNFHCIDSLPSLGNVQVYGFMVHDVGCDFTNMKINGKWIDYDAGTTQLAKKLVKKKQLNELLFLLNEVYLKQESVLLKTQEAIVSSDYAFTEPFIQQLSEGYQVKAWVIKPAQQGLKDTYSLSIFVINKKGEINRTDLSSFQWHVGKKMVIE